MVSLGIFITTFFGTLSGFPLTSPSNGPWGLAGSHGTALNAHNLKYTPGQPHVLHERVIHTPVDPKQANQLGQRHIPPDHPALEPARVFGIPRVASGGPRDYNELQLIIPPIHASRPLELMPPQQRRLEPHFNSWEDEMPAHADCAFDDGLDFWMAMSVDEFAKGEWIQSFPKGFYELLILKQEDQVVRFMKVGQVPENEIGTNIQDRCRPGFTSMLSKDEYTGFMTGEHSVGKCAVKFRITKGLGNKKAITAWSNGAKSFCQHHDPASWKVIADKLNLPWNAGDWTPFRNVHDSCSLTFDESTSQPSDVCNPGTGTAGAQPIVVLVHSAVWAALGAIVPFALCLCGVAGCIFGILCGYLIKINGSQKKHRVEPYNII